MKFAVIGGDMRIARLAALLEDDGHEVNVFALEKAGRTCSQYAPSDPPGHGEAMAPLGPRSAVTIEAAVAGANCVVLPLPVTERKGILSTPLSSSEISMGEALGVIAPGTLVCAGRVDDDTRALAKKRGLVFVDYFKREELAVLNAAATAEGAIDIIMRNTPITVWKSKVLVIGFGRVGKLTAHRLHGLRADVTVSARNYGDMAWIESLGYKALDTRALEGQLAEFDVVVNTVPSLVLPESRLWELKPGALCLDLASKPGGADIAFG